MEPIKKAKIEAPQQYLIQFFNPDGVKVGPELDIPSNATNPQLQQLLQQFADDDEPHNLYVQDVELTTDLLTAAQQANIPNEYVVPLTYHPQSRFRCFPITRATSNLEGHTESILTVQFSGNGKGLATGSGDTTVRVWDLLTETPQFELKGHNNWVLVVAWSPNHQKLASAGMDGKICIWNPHTGEQIGRTISAHRKWINSIAWKPAHLDIESTLLASASKDRTIKIWNVDNQQCMMTLNGHSNSISKIIWGGSNLIYSASHDRLIKVWNAQDGRQLYDLRGHGHWVNQLSCSTDYALRTGAFDPLDPEGIQSQQKAQEQYQKVLGSGERLVSCSDDFTLFLWKPSLTQQSLQRMTGHQQQVTQVLFSPDTNLIISASFDKSIKLWNGYTGGFIATFRGHVGPVYQISWSPDSRMFVTGSKDSTLKIFNVSKKKLLVNLPGHADQVYSVDWSPDGLIIASGSRDRILNIWRNQ